MAYTKKNAGNAKAVHTAELTTGQLVLAVCTFLIVLLGVFLLGIIVGEYQFKMRETRGLDVATLGTVGEGVQPGGFDAVKRDTGAASATGSSAPEPYRARTDSATSSVVVPAPAPSRETTKPAPVASTPLPPPSPTTNAAAAPQPATTSTPPPAPAPEPIAILEAAEPEPPASDADTADETGPIALLPDEPEATASAPPAAPTAGKIYSVQVAALSEPKNADSIKKRIESTTTWPVEISRSSTNKLHMVLVGRFATEAEAAKVRDELRKRSEFSQAFIHVRSAG